MKKILFLLISVPAVFANQQQLLDTLGEHVQSAEPMMKALQSLINDDRPLEVVSSNFFSTDPFPFFDAFPELRTALPRVAFANLPTPIERMSTLEPMIGVGQLYIKRDDLTGEQYGGNKVRKLEFIFGDALSKDAKTVLTFGARGSNHAVATACYAQQLGLKCYLMLKPQENSDVVRMNNLLMQHFNSIIQYCPSPQLREMQAICACMRNKVEFGDFPYVIPTGGSTEIGIVGFVAAAFELKEQITAGIMPEPDYIYVTAGTCGTVAGLILGLKVAGLSSQVVPVTVEPENRVKFLNKIIKPLEATNRLLNSKDISFPLVHIKRSQIKPIFRCAGIDYGVPTEESTQARTLVAQTEGISLDPTYTSKGFAGLLSDAAANKLRDKVVLFWHTFSAVGQEASAQEDFHLLPVALHNYYEDTK